MTTVSGEPLPVRVLRIAGPGTIVAGDDIGRVHCVALESDYLIAIRESICSI